MVLVEDTDTQWGLKRTTDATTQIVTTSDMKDHERVDLSADDDLIDTYITAARVWAENWTRRAFLSQTWELVMDEYPVGDVLRIPRPPLISIDSIVDTDEDGNDTTFAASNYIVDTHSLPGRVVLDNNVDWPSRELEPANAVTVTFTAGYGTDRSDVPEPIIQAIKQLVGHWYEHRESVVVGTTGFNVPQTVEFLLGNYRVPAIV